MILETVGLIYINQDKTITPICAKSCRMKRSYTLMNTFSRTKKSASSLTGSGNALVRQVWNGHILKSAGELIGQPGLTLQK